MAKNPKAHRLPPHVRPVEYDIHLRADPAQPDFGGTVMIRLVLDKATHEIELHARELDITSAVLKTPNGDLPAVAETHDEQETVMLRLADAAPAAECTLVIEYTAKVGQAMAGLYLSEDANERCLATQCEATDARAIIPCFDEPMFKARFGWTITAPSQHTVLANGPLAGRHDNDDGTTTWTFEPTPPMSSYLIACAIGPFAATPSRDENHVPFQVWALGGKQRLGIHGRDFAAQLMPWYEDYFGVPYHWGKYDQIAVPSFSFGAMENPGLVLFRASLLLMDPKSASWREEKSVDLVVAHEFAHMWFGNLVTMKWWDDLWLNEAFAEWICHKAVDAIAPKHEVWNEFAHRTNRALETDALDSTHAIYHPVQTPDEAGELFDAITYGKGSATLRMLEGYLGEESFRAGLRTYMAAFAEANAAGKDLWRHLGEVSDQPVPKIMDSWITQPGHPLVSVALVEEKDGHARLRLEQTRARSAPGAAKTDQLWHVPLVLRWKDGNGEHTTRHLLTQRSDEITLRPVGALTWLHGNASDIGFYRTRPDTELLWRLATHYEDLDAPERRGLLRDQWALVKSGDRAITDFLDLLHEAIPTETHYTATEEIVGTLREIERLFETKGDRDALTAFRAWVGERFAPHYDRLGLKAAADEHPGEALRRAAVLRAIAGIAGHADAIEGCRRIAATERSTPADVDPNLAGVAVAVNAMYGDVAAYDTHFQTYESRRDGGAPPQQVERYLYTLATFRDAHLVGRTIAALPSGKIAKQAVGPLLRLMLSEPHAQDPAWRHLHDNWEDVRKNLGEAWTNILVEAAGELPPRLAGDVVTFFDKALDGKLAQQSYGRAKEKLAERGSLMERVLPGIASWLDDKRAAQ